MVDVKIGGLYATIGADIRQMVAAERQTNAIASKIESRLQSMSQAASRSFLAIGGGLAVGSQLKGLLDAQIAIERIQNTMKAGVGGALAAEEMAFVTRESDRLGLSLITTAEQYAKLAVATRGTTMEGKATRDLFGATSEAAARLGLGVEQVEGTFNAFVQMVSKGVVQAEELRGQMGDRLVGAFNIASRAMGKTTEEMNSMLKKGELLASDLLPQMAIELRKSFGIQGSWDSTQASLNRLSNALFKVRTDLTADYADDFAQGARLIADNLDEITQGAILAAGAFGTLAATRTIGGIADGVMKAVAAERQRRVAIAWTAEAQLAQAKIQEYILRGEKAEAAQLAATAQVKRNLVFLDKQASNSKLAEANARLQNIRAQQAELQNERALAIQRRDSAQARLGADIMAPGYVGSKSARKGVASEASAAEREIKRLDAALVRLNGQAQRAQSSLIRVYGSGVKSFDKDSAKRQIKEFNALDAATRQHAAQLSIVGVRTKEYSEAQKLLSIRSQAGATAMNALKTAGNGVLSLLGGWPGVVFAAGAALVYLTKKSNEARDALLEQVKAQQAAFDSAESAGLSPAVAAKSELSGMQQKYAELGDEISGYEKKLARLRAQQSGAVNLTSIMGFDAGQQNNVLRGQIAEAESLLASRREAYARQEEMIRKQQQKLAEAKAPPPPGGDTGTAEALLNPAIEMNAELDKQREKLEWIKRGDEARLPVLEANQRFAEAEAKQLEKVEALRKSLASLDPTKEVGRAESVRAELAAQEGLLETLRASKAEYIGKAEAIAQLEQQVKSSEDARREAERKEADRLRDLEQLRERAMKANEDATPQTRYNAAMAELNALMATGVLTQEAYNKGRREANDELQKSLNPYREYLDNMAIENRLLEARASGLADADLKFLEKRMELESRKERPLNRGEELWIKEQIQREAELTKAVERRKELEDLAKSAKSDAMTDPERYAQAVRDANDAVNAGLIGERERIYLIREAQREYTTLGQLSGDLASTFTSGIENMIFGTGTFQEKLQDLGVELQKLIFRALVLKQIEDALAGWAAGGFKLAGAAASAGAGAASGPGFGAGGVPDSRFAKGGVVDRPTYFGMGGGRRGVAGEAGTEGIFPLRRGPNGELGVQAYGGGSEKPEVIVQIINQAKNTEVEQRTAKGSQGQDVRQFIIKTVSEWADGGGLDRTNRQRYGNVPQGVAHS